MATPTPQEVIDALNTLRDELDSVLTDIEHNLPASAPSVEVLRGILGSVLTSVTVQDLQRSLNAALAAVKAGKSEFGVGADADLS